MIYTYRDFLNLELKNKTEIEEEIDNALREYSNVQDYFKSCEEDTDMYPVTFGEPSMPLDILFKNLKNIESYIRKAENLLHNYDGINRKPYIRNKKVTPNKKTISSIRKNIVRKKVR